MMDDPRHTQIRRLVSSGLTPRMIRLVEDDLRARTRRLLDAVVPGEPFDFLVDIAAELPMQMICILLGVPESERHWLFEAIEPQFDFGGSRKACVVAAVGRGGRLADVHLRPGVDRVEACPADRRHVVGRRQRGSLPTTPRPCPTSSCICSSACCSAPARRRPATRSPAGCWHWPTIRSNYARCVRIWTRCRPRSRRWSGGRRRRRPSGARPPAVSRSAARRSQAGQKVQIWEGSANRDASVFDDADEFDIARKPNPHLGFRPGCALLPGRQPGPARTAGAVRRAAVAVRNRAGRA